MKAIIDNFSSSSDSYATFRPQSPDAVFDFLYQHVQGFTTAWDCGTGNGQVAARLAERFGHVYGTDISAQQLQLAQPRPNITYLQERAEATTIAAGTVNLITIAQAIHWFDFDAFYKEVNRVAAPGAVIAAWTYNVLRLTPEVNIVIDRLYKDVTYAYWDPERKYVDAGYTTIPFPFREVAAPPVHISARWDINRLVGYLGTWSGVKNYIRKEGKNPVLLVADELRAAWGDNDELDVYFPVNIRVGYVS